MQKQEVTLTEEKITTFKITQKIFESCREISRNLSDCDLTLPASFEPDPTLGITQQGLRLIERGYPRFIETPWGLCTLYTKAEHYNPNCFNAPTESLLEIVHVANTERISSWDYKNNNDARLKNTQKIDFIIGILGMEVHRRILSMQEYLQRTPGLKYDIIKIDGEECPTPISPPKESSRTIEEIKAEWEALKILAKNNYVVTQPLSIKSPKTPKKSPKPLTTMPPLLTNLPTAEPSDPSSPKSPLTKPNSPHRQECFTLLTSPALQETHIKTSPQKTVRTPDLSCSSVYRF